MNLLLPLAATILQTASAVVDKIILSKRKLPYETYIAYSFPMIFIVNALLMILFAPPFGAYLFTNTTIMLLAADIIIIVGANIFYYKLLKKESLSETYTIGLLSNIPSVLVVGLFFASERSPLTLILALISVGVLAAAHYKNGRLFVSKKEAAYAIWTLAIFPFGAVISKQLLFTWSPISLEFVRGGLVTAVMLFFYARYLKSVDLKTMMLLITTNAVSAIGWIYYFFSYQQSGVVFTILVISLQPLLVYFASVFLLKEKLEMKKFMAFCIIVLSIIVVEIIK